jgi:hypothetical protein
MYTLTKFYFLSPVSYLAVVFFHNATMQLVWSSGKIKKDPRLCGTKMETTKEDKCAISFENVQII